jgi:hypothetical protein
MWRVGFATSPYDVAWRIFLVGIGLGPSLPLLNLAMQNAVMPNQIGAVTASRQFFQQLGQALGGAVFGVVLATTLTVQLQQNLTPIVQELPPAAQAQLDPEVLRNSISAAEGGSQQVDLGAQLADAAVAPIERQRALAQAALVQGDAQARAQLLSSPNTPPAIKELVQGSAAADTQALAQVDAALDAAEQQAREEGRQAGQRVEGAVKQSLATSITSIYFYAIWLAIAALALIVLWLPEIPLRKSNRIEVPVME